MCCKTDHTNIALQFAIALAPMFLKEQWESEYGRNPTPLKQTAYDLWRVATALAAAAPNPNSLATMKSHPENQPT